MFGGNSGGPVFNVPAGMDKYGNFNSGMKTGFIGIVIERRLSPIEITIRKDTSQSNNQDSMFSEKLLTEESIGIGLVEPASKVRALLDLTKKELLK